MTSPYAVPLDQLRSVPPEDLVEERPADDPTPDPVVDELQRDPWVG